MTRRSLSAKERLRLFTLHGGICHFCNGRINGVREGWDISHELPLELGGSDEDDANMKPAHRKCHRAHTSAVDVPAIAKAKRIERKHLGIAPKQSRPMPGSKSSGLRKRMNGTVERRP